MQEESHDRHERTEKTASTLRRVPHRLLALLPPEALTVGSRLAEAAAVEALWVSVGEQPAPRGRWQASDPRRGQGLADGLGRRQAAVLLQRSERLEPFGIPRSATDSGGASARPVDTAEHQPGQHNPQQLERNPLT